VRLGSLSPNRPQVYQKPPDGITLTQLRFSARPRLTARRNSSPSPIATDSRYVVTVLSFRRASAARQEESAVRRRMRPSKRNVFTGKSTTSQPGEKGLPRSKAGRARVHSCCRSRIKTWASASGEWQVTVDEMVEGYLPGSVNSGFGIASSSSSFCRCSRRALLMFTDASSSFFPSSLRPIRIRICPRR
jgi:hypothetical protein